MPDDWPQAEPITATRLTLEPLSVEHAPAMVPVLADDALYAFIGGHAPGLDELTRRYARQAAGRSPAGDEGWLNWVVRERRSGELVGTVQATLRDSGELVADIAWVIGVGYQGRGYASEAAAAMLAWLLASGVRDLRAYIHPAHAASLSVAARLGLTPTDVVVDGEQRWQLRPS